MEQTFFITRKVEVEEKVPVTYPSFFRSGGHAVGIFNAENIISIYNGLGYASVSKQESPTHISVYLLNQENAITKKEFEDELVEVYTKIGSPLLPSLAIAS